MKRTLPRLIYGVLALTSLVFTAWLAGCMRSDIRSPQVEGETQATAASAEAVVPERKSLMTIATATASATAPLPTQAALPLAAPAQLPGGPNPPGLALIGEDDLRQEATYHNAILFTSRSGVPFRGSSLGTQNMGQTPVEGLWLMKLDALSAAPLTPPGLSSAVDHPAQARPRFVDFGVEIPEGVIEGLQPPAACVPPDGWNGDPQVFTPCTDFRFSADGNLLAYEIPIHGCSRQLHLINLQTSKPVLEIKERGHFLRPLSNGRWLYATGSCGEGEIALYDPLTGKKTVLGPEPAGDLAWNPQRSAFIAHVFNEGGQEVALWGYNVESGQVFLSMRAEADAYYGMPTWTPDGQGVIFQYRKGARSEDGQKVIFNNPRYLIRVDIATRSQSQILDPTGDLAITPGWFGDSLMVRRYPLQSQSFDAATLHYSSSFELPPVVKCITRAEECALKPEWLGYNYRTGKLFPWAESGHPAATATPNYEHPELNLDEPVYEDPGGAFRVVLGPPMPYMPDNLAWQGYASLWYLPSGGEPVLWVESGRGFTRIP